MSAPDVRLMISDINHNRLFVTAFYNFTGGRRQYIFVAAAAIYVGVEKLVEGGFAQIVYPLG